MIHASFLYGKILRMVKTNKKGLLSIILLILLFGISCFVLCAMLWLFRTWPRLQMSELIYQLTMPFTGTGSKMIENFLLQVVVPTLIVLVVLIVLLVCIYKKEKICKLTKTILIVVSCVCLFASCIYTFIRLDVGNYLKDQNTESTFIEDHYVDPSEVNVTFPENKRNLIVIYLESMEITYSDVSGGGGMKEDYIPELTKLAEDNEDFSSSSSQLNGAYSYPYTTWTMGGLFATSAGLPLMTSIDRNQIDTQNSFFSNTTVLGDILEKEGYTQVYACGSDATFGGRKLYYQQHGSYQIHDLNYRREAGDLDLDYYENWGFEDSKLIEWAKEDISELADSNTPFNYTMLTADTHFEDGYECDDCQDIHDGNQYGNVISCSSKRIYEFIEWCKTQDWYDNTTIVLTGDHPTMDSDFCNEVSEEYQRRVYTCFINARPIENKSASMRSYSTFDLFPTILSSLSVSIEGNQLGLGVDLFSGEETLSESIGTSEVEQQLYYKSSFMKELENNEEVTNLISRKMVEKEEQETNASVTETSSLFSKEVTVYVENWDSPEKVKHMICVTYNDNEMNEIIMALNYNNQYETTFETLGNIKVYAQYEDSSIVYVGQTK